jgi:arsenite methyltransferase
MRVHRELAETYAAWFKCLADPTRVLILHHLASERRELRVGEIVEAVGVGQSTVSHHLKQLVETGFVVADRRGTSTYVRVNECCLEEFPSAADLVMGRLPQLKIAETDVRGAVRRAYGEVARGAGRGCGCGTDAAEVARSVGYSGEELTVIPSEANLGLSCGNPTALASLREGETVLDLGSGAGFDCFLAASRVGPRGRVIGVDMTPEMIAAARATAERRGVDNVDFREGEMERLPVPDSSVDVVISNCAVNLSTDKQRVFQEIHRVLRPDGRVAISDIALVQELPETIRDSVNAYVGCVAGAMLVEDYARTIEAAGFTDVSVTSTGPGSCTAPDTADPIGRAILEGIGQESLDSYVVSVCVEAWKPVRLSRGSRPSHRPGAPAGTDRSRAAPPAGSSRRRSPAAPA